MSDQVLCPFLMGLFAFSSLSRKKEPGLLGELTFTAACPSSPREFHIRIVLFLNISKKRTCADREVSQNKRSDSFLFHSRVTATRWSCEQRRRVVHEVVALGWETPRNTKEKGAEVENTAPGQPPLRWAAAGLAELERPPVSSAEGERMLLAEDTVAT